MQKAAEAARAAVLAEAEQARRDAETAKAEAQKARTALEAAVRQAREEAEQAAAARRKRSRKKRSPAAAATLPRSSAAPRRPKRRRSRHYEAEQRLAAEIKQHQEFLARAGSAEREAPAQIEAAERLMAALSDAMIELHGFEHAPLPPVARKWAMAQQMCAQMADAITAFLAPRVEETRV